MASVIWPSSRHRGDDLVGALGRAAWIVVGRQFRRRLHQAGEHGRLRQGHVLRRMTEIFFRRRIDAIGAGAEIDAVEIEFENLVLGVFMLQPERQNGLLDLSRNRALLRQEQVLRQLLGQGRAALHHAPACNVAEQGAEHADGIDAPMAVKTAVLDGDEGLGQIRREILQPDRRAAGVAAIGEKRPVHTQHGDIRRAFWDGEMVDMRQLRAVIDEKPARADHAPDEEHEAPVDQPAEQRRLALFRPCLAFPGLSTQLGGAPLAARGARLRFDARRRIFRFGVKVGPIRSPSAFLRAMSCRSTPFRFHAGLRSMNSPGGNERLVHAKTGGLRAG